MQPRVPAALFAVLPAACGADAVTPPAACPALVYDCAGGAARVRVLAGEALPFGGPDVLARPGDVLLENDRVALVVDALDHPHHLAPTGGSILDLAPIGGFDQVNQIYTVAGILPDDAFAYTSMEIVDESPARVALVLRGTLDGRAAVEVATRIEVRRCEPGVRVSSKLTNRTPDVMTFILSDVSFWGNRQPLPFAPVAGGGFDAPALDLIEIDTSWRAFPYLAARATAEPAVAYAFVPCNRASLEGVNDPQVTAAGEPRTVVHPGESMSFARFVIAAPGPDVESAVALAQEARAKLGRETTRAIGGRITAAGAGFGGDETRAAVIVSAAGRPVSEVIPAADGSFTATVPDGEEIAVEVWSFGRPRATALVGADGDAGELAVPPPARVTLDTAGDDALIVFVPADEETRDATRGTQQKRFTPCAPYLGPPHGGSPACNRVLVRGAAQVDVPAGHYFVYATRGPFHTLAREEVTLAAGEVATIALRSTPIAGLPATGGAGGVWSADLHVHGRASFDSSIPDEDRALAFAAAGLDVLAATDHDVVGRYDEALAALGLADRVVVLPGVETTGLIPFLDVPDDPFPRVIGHFNFFPVSGDPPWDELLEPGALFDRMEPLLAPSGLAMMNHPWEDAQTGRDLGWLRAVKWDPREPLPAADDGTRAGLLVRRPAGGRSNLAVELIEVLNGRSIVRYQQHRVLWDALTAQGHVFAGTANSDSHGLTDAQVGWPRNLVRAPAPFDEEAFLAALRRGEVVGTNGPVLEATLGGVAPALEPISPGGDTTVVVRVRAAPWIPTQTVVLRVNGVEVARETLAAAPDPLGDAPIDDEVSFDLAPWLAAGDDVWVSVEAGLFPLPAVADLDDDGVPETTDNDGDGDVDLGDVEPGEDAGPFLDPPCPEPWDDDPRVHLCAVEPGTWPIAFTNPWLVDVDGDGTWRAPGP